MTGQTNLSGEIGFFKHIKY